MKKKILTKFMFEELLKRQAKKMSKDTKLLKSAHKVIQQADEYMYIHQTKFLGETSLNLPEDLFLIQEVIYNCKPDYVIEIGVAWGGTSLFISSILEQLGNGKLIGIDIFLPNDLKKRLFNKGKISKRIRMIEGSSLDDKIFKKLENITKNKKVLVILDSNHTEKHVTEELKIYSKLVSKNSYIICCDTILDYIKPNKNRKREWNKNNNPMGAVKDFVKMNKNYVIDKEINNKVLLSCNPNGYLKRIK
jgi:cephalosporin hydroxylase